MYIGLTRRDSPAQDIQMQSPIVSSIANYLKRHGAHRSGAMDVAQIQAIERLYDKPGLSMETGCGVSTILLSNLSRRHLVFCVDDREYQNGAVEFVQSAPSFHPGNTEFVFGPTQKMLSTSQFEGMFDLVLLDGPHAYPFVELEYYFVYPHLKPGALLIVDDIHIPTSNWLYRFLKEDAMFAFLERVENTAFFRRSDAPTFDPYGDGWEYQNFNKSHFPAHDARYRLNLLFSNLTPTWVTRLMPPVLRRAIKARLVH
jgi:predicted O-methyltransferase YrrM